MSYPYELSDMQYDIGTWAEKTFPKSTQDSLIAHLRDEVNNEIHPDCDPEELADAAMLLIHLSHKRGVNLQQLILQKFEKCKQRTWSTTPNEKGFFPHIKETPDESTHP